MTTAVVLPELGTGDETIHLSGWLVEAGDTVVSGDRVAEVLVRGITFDVSAPESGVFTGIEKPLDSVVVPGDVLGWMEAESPDEFEPTENSPTDYS